MSAPEQLRLVVPLYNESHRFAECAPQLADFVAARAPSRLVFVDDGSTDDTPELVRQFIAERPGECVELIVRPHQGKGAAIEAGFAALRHGIGAFCDVDLATPLPELAVIIDAAERAPVLAIGSRGTAASRLTRRQSPVRELLGRAYNRAIQLAVTPGIADTQCGAKAATAEVWQSVLPWCHENGFAWDVEVIAVARARGIPVQEVGIEWCHQDGSRVRPLRDGVRMLRAIPRIRSNAASVRQRGATPAGGAGVFDDANAERLASTDAEHWWFRSKATFVSLLIRRYSPRQGLLVDIGAGSGGVTALLGWPPDQTLALEGNEQLVSATVSRHALLTSVCDGEAVPVRDGAATVVCLLDVIEHVADPGPMLREAARIVAADGCVIVNVPGHPRLWSEADEILGHARRYTRAALTRDLERSGLEVEWMSHVFSWLTLPVWLQRRVGSSSEDKLGLAVSSPLIDRLSMLLTRIEARVTRRVSLPIGTSVLCVARVAGFAASGGGVDAAAERGEALFALQQTLYESRNPTRRLLHRSRRDWVIDAIGRHGPGSERALEVGPGSGVYLPSLAAVADEVVAADIEQAYLDRLTPLTGLHLNVRLVWDDITDSAFADDSFDLMLCSEVIEHIADSPAAFGELRRLLRPGGVLIVSTPQKYSPLELSTKLAFLPGIIDLVRRIYKEPVLVTGHINLLTRHQLREQLETAGFELIEQRLAGVYLPVVAETLGERAVQIEGALETRLRGSRFEGLLWTQFVVARPATTPTATTPALR